MGYPMTYRRVISRNSLPEGDYESIPHSLQTCVNVNPKDDGYADIGQVRRERLLQYEGQFRSLCGDLRRLERDAVDEKAVCEGIAMRTGIDVDTIAAVLLEFFSI